MNNLPRFDIPSEVIKLLKFNHGCANVLLSGEALLISTDIARWHPYYKTIPQRTTHCLMGNVDPSTDNSMSYYLYGCYNTEEEALHALTVLEMLRNG
jgi:hypothetical protein